MRKLFPLKSKPSDDESPAKEVKDVEKSTSSKKHWSAVFRSQKHAKPDGDTVNSNSTMSHDLDETADRVDKPSRDDATNSDKRDKGTSWDVTPVENDSFSTVGTSATISTLKHFGLSNHPGKGADDVTIDAFMDIKSDKEESLSKRSATKRVYLKPYVVDLNHSALHTTALSCIAKRDFNQLLNIVKETPEILLYQCNKKAPSTRDVNGQSDDRPNLRGCYGGTLLHVLVSQKPTLKKKRVKNSNSVKSRVTSALSCSGKSNYELHIMPSIPDSVLTYIIKKQPKALQMIDDFGRLPIHCATLSLSVHLEEVNTLYGICSNSDETNASYDISQIFVREINLIHLLLKYNRKSVTVADFKGNLPIHYAVCIGTDYFESDKVTFLKANKFEIPSAAATVKYLLEAYPRSVCVGNKDGNLPIHSICNRGPDINLTTLKKIMTYQNVCRDALTETNRRGDPPLFLAIKSRATEEAIRLFASLEQGAPSKTRLFAQRDGNNDNPLHVALRLSPSADPVVIRTIMSLAPFTASTPDRKGRMPIWYATYQDLPEDIIRQMLARDMPIQIGTAIDSDGKSASGLARHVVGRSHHHSWWHILIECYDKYLDLVKSFLSEEATHAQIVTLARQVGPDGVSILINCVSDKCRLVFHALLRFYDRYEILLSSKDAKVKPDEIIDGVQTFLALDHGLSTDLPNEYSFTKLHTSTSNLSCMSETSFSTAVRVRDNLKDDPAVEISLLSKEKSKVILRCFQHEEAFFAELKVREKYDFPRQYFEDLYNYHRDETYTYLTLSKSEKLCCITYERPDHTLSEVFASVSSGGQRSQKWIEKCWIVLKQIATTLKFLHEQNLVHGHLAPENIAKYANTWKIGKLGTVSRVGMTMRGTFRSCAPPESVSMTVSNRAQGPLSQLDGANKSNTRVKFSRSIEEIASNGTIATEDDSSDDASKVTPPVTNSQQGNGNNNFMSFLGFTSTPADVSKEKQKSVIVVEEPKSNTRSGTPVFIAEKCQATPQWDMWGFGLVMVQLLLGRCMLLPNFEKAEDAILKKLHNYDGNQLRQICKQLNLVAGQEASDLVMKLLQKDPNLRPKSMEEILSHKYFEALTIYV